MGMAAATIGSSAIGAGASMLGGSKASSAAEDAAGSASANAGNLSNLNLLGFFASKAQQEQAAQAGRELLAQGRDDQNVARDNALKALVDSEAYWNDAYNTGSANIQSGLSGWDDAYKQVRADQANYMALGDQGVAGYSGLLKDPTSITNDPGYQFRLTQGVQGLDRSAAAKGKLFSGAQGKAVTEYGQNYATNEYDKALARYQQAINTGQNATSQVNSAGMQTAAGKGTMYNALANLAMNKAQGLSNLGTAKAGVYQGWGDDMWASATANTGLELGLADDIVNAWQNTVKNISNTSTDATNTAAQATTAGASASNNALGGVANSLTSGVGNYLKYSMNNSSYGANPGSIGNIK